MLFVVVVVVVFSLWFIKRQLSPLQLTVVVGAGEARVRRLVVVEVVSREAYAPTSVEVPLSRVVMRLGHEVQEEYPAALCLPISQAVQADAPAPEKLPASHASHDVLSAELAVPGEQRLQMVAAS